MALYLLTRDERTVLAIERRLLTHIQLKNPAFPWGLKAFQSFYFSNLYLMLFPLSSMVGSRSRASLIAKSVKSLPAMQQTQVQFLGWEDPLEKEMATQSSILAWRIAWTEEPGRLQSMGVTRVTHDRVTKRTHTEE